MSEPFASSGEVRPATCKCGATVVEEKMHGMYGSTRWSVRRHDAPCGLPCFAAGVYGAVYRTGRFHRDNKRCPACAGGGQ